MRAQVLIHPGPLEEHPLKLLQVPLPKPARGEVRIRVRCCGVCLTDKHICEGELPVKHPSIIPGHQVVGIVEQTLGRRFQIGDRVGAVWLGSTCGECRYCRLKQENLCEKALFTGWDLSGGYAEYMVAHEDYIHPLPATMSDEHIAPLLCAGVIGYRSLLLSGAGPGAKLGLYGFGNSAHIVLQIAKHLKMETYAFARSEHHRALAKKLGATWVGNTHETPPDPLTHAIIFAPAGEIVLKVLRDLDRGGKIAINAIHMSDIPPLPYADLYYEKSIQSVTHGTRQDATNLLSLLKECPIHTTVQTFPLEQTGEALLQQKRSQIGAAGVILVD